MLTVDTMDDCEASIWTPRFHRIRGTMEERLEIIEGLLTRNKAENAERLARMVIAEFTRAALNKRVITALGYLTRAIAAKKASVPLVHNVRDYILRLRTNPEREFLRRALPTVSGPGQGSEQ